LASALTAVLPLVLAAFLALGPSSNSKAAN
jgi:hypothetical protein